MGDLKEQMLKAGLITEKQAKRAGHENRVKAKKSSHKEREQETTASKEAIAREKAARSEADRQRSQARQAEVAKQEQATQASQRNASQIKSALNDGEISHWGGARKYHFADGKRIEVLAVNDDTVRRLESGNAAIARGKTGYLLLTATAARKLLEAEPERIVTFHQD